MPSGKVAITTHERSRSSSDGKDEIVEEKILSGILEKPLRRRSVKEGTVRGILRIVWDPTPDSSLVKDRKGPRMKF